MIEGLEGEALPIALDELRAYRKTSETSVLGLLENALVLRWTSEARADVLSYLQDSLDWNGETTLTLPLKLSLLYEADPEAYPDFLREQPAEQRNLFLQTSLTFVPKDSELYPHLVSELSVATEASAQANSELAGPTLDLEVMMFLITEDPARAIRELQDYLAAGGPAHRVYQPLKELSKHYPEHAGILAMDLILKDPDSRRALGDVILEWAKVDPATVLLEIQSIPSISTRKDLYMKGYLGWATSDAEKAIHHAYAYIPTSSECYEVLPVLLNKWMKQDPAAAAAFLEALPPNAISNYSQVYVPWVKADPKAAMTHLLAFSDQELSLKSDGNTLGQLLQVWMQDDLQAARSWVGELPNVQMKDEIIEAMLNRFPNDRFEEGIALLTTMQSPTRQLSSLGHLLNREFGDDAPEKIKVLDTFERTPGIERLLMHKYQEWARNDVMAVVNNFPTDLGYNFQRSLSKDVALAYYGKDRDASMEWMREVHPAFQGLVYKEVAKAIAYKEGGPQAAQFLKDMGPVGIGQSAYEVIASEWSDKDPQASMRWAVSLGDHDGRTVAVSTSYAALLEKNPAQATQWLEKRSSYPKEYQEMAVVTWYHYLQSNDISSGAKWVMEVEDPRTQRNMLRFATREMNEVEKDQFRASLLSSNTFSQEQQIWIRDDL